MTTNTVRGRMLRIRCCYPGCETLRATIRSGYRVGFGFMLWACDEHAQMYKDFDRRDRDHYQAFSKARLEAEETFDEQYLKDNPYPTIDYQQSAQSDREVNGETLQQGS